MTIRFGLRTKLVLLSSFLFTIPWFGYQYVWEMEKYLRYGQEQTLIGTARALATALHDRPNLFNNQASFLSSVEKGKDLYGFELKHPIQLDGKFDDWPDYQGKSHLYAQPNILWQADDNNNTTLSYTAAVGKYDKYLYLFFNVVDNTTILRQKNARSIVKNDHLLVSLIAPNGAFEQYAISNKNSGWVDAFSINSPHSEYPSPVSFIQGTWLTTNHGYNIEIRIPLTHVGNNIAFAIADVDDINDKAIALIGSSNTSQQESLGTILVPSPEIERIVKGMSNTHSSIWVVDKHQRVLASAGSLNEASGVWQTRLSQPTNSHWWQRFEQQLLHPLYYKILTKPTKDFIDELYDESNLTGTHINQALTGSVSSNWRVTTDNKAVILSAAYPIFIDDKVQGAVIVEETTNGIKTIRNKALEKLFTSILAILLIGSLAFFFFASRVSARIRKLSNQAELAIDEHGRVKKSLDLISANDEIGDLSRSFSRAVSRLSQYNHYLENMSSRLSHELRTPIAVVRTSLENLTMHPIPDSASPYIERAQSGIHRLNHIITSMTEATRVEQILQRTEKSTFNAITVIEGCVQGYRQIYPQVNFELELLIKQVNVQGSPEYFAQMLEKVLTNAVEFCNDNKVTIVAVVVKKQLQIIIKNNGPQLPDNMEDKLFDSMVSVRDEQQQSSPHLGLGLFIARLICEFHDASINAQNLTAPDGVQITVEVKTV